MTPDSMDTRVRDLERSVAGLTATVAELGRDVHSLATVAETTTRLDERMKGVESAVKTVRAVIEDREKSTSDERKAVRVAILGLTGVVMAALISGAFAFAATVLS